MAEKPADPYFFVQYGPNEGSKTLFNSSCKCHTLLDAIKDTCSQKLDNTIRKRLSEIHSELRDIQNLIRNLEREKEMAAQMAGDGEPADEGNGDDEAKLKNAKEEETQRIAEEERLSDDLKTIAGLDMVDLAELDSGKSLELRSIKDSYAYEKLAPTKTYRLLRVEKNEDGGDVETPVDVNV